MKKQTKAIRLQKFLSECGVASRRKAEVMISAGQVKVNRKVISELGTTVIPGKDRVFVDGKPVRPRKVRKYLMLNKPAGCLTTLSDPEKRPTISDFIPKISTRLFPVGRLDWSTEGLLLLTDDGELTHRLTHPSYRVQKIYLAKVRGTIEQMDPILNQMREGVELDDGPIKVNSVKIHRVGERSTWIFVTISEGRNRVVRRLFDAVGHEVIRLKRIGLGPLEIGRLPSGAFRWLSESETRELLTSVELTNFNSIKKTRKKDTQFSRVNRRKPKKNSPRKNK